MTTRDLPSSAQSRLPPRTVSQARALPSSLINTTGQPSLGIPPVTGVPNFYPQSLWTDQLAGGVDHDDLRVHGTYRMLAHQRLEVGKYVPDPNNEDFSNPKYVPPGGRRASDVESAGYLTETESIDSRGASRGQQQQRRSSRRPRRSGSSTRGSTLSLNSPPSTTITATGLGTASTTSVKVNYPVVEPLYPSSAASLFFPVYYGRPSAKDVADLRGLPQQINEELHPNDRPGLPLSSVSVQKDNLNRMCLYKIGPGAVAFKVVMSAFEAAGMQYTPSNSLFNILWAKRATLYTLASLTPYQKVNHFPGTWGIGRKDSLAQNMHKMRRYFGDDVFDIVPTSFLIPRQKVELQYDAERYPGTPENPLIYIVKPSASSCGRGITLHKGMPPMPRGCKQMVCQRYIGNPLLIYGRKFDLRMYCVVTSFDPLRIYLFDEGLVRFAAEKYPGPDKALENIHMHLTNYSVNKTAELNRESRGKDYDGEDAVDIKWCISDLKKYLAGHHPDGIQAWEKILRGCDDVVVKTFLSIEQDVVDRIRAECKDKTGRNCFELFGLDLMADEQLKVRLIEANIMPSLATGITLDKAVKSRVLAHMLTLVRVIPCKRNMQSCSPTGATASNSSDGAYEDESNAAEAFVPCGAYPSRPERMYSFGKHPNASALIKEQRPLLRSFNSPENPDSMLSAEETLMLVESEEELHCAGGFRPIFPVASTVRQYLPLFTHGVRRNNYLLASAVTMAAKKSE